MIEIGKPSKDIEWKYVRIVATKYDALIRTLEQAGCHMEYKLNEYCYYKRTESVRHIIKELTGKDIGCYLTNVKLEDYHYWDWASLEEFRKSEFGTRYHIQQEKERRYNWQKKSGTRKKKS